MYVRIIIGFILLNFVLNFVLSITVQSRSDAHGSRGGWGRGLVLRRDCLFEEAVLSLVNWFDDIVRKKGLCAA